VRLFGEQRFAQAEPLARLMTQRFPQFAFGWKVLGAIVKRTGRTDEAIAIMRHGLALDPKDAEGHCNLGNTLRDARRVQEAQASYRAALLVNPEFVQAHINLGCLLHDQQQFEQARDCLNRALAIQPDHAAALSNLAATLRELGRPQDSEAACSKALALDPHLVDALDNLGLALADQNRLVEAQAAYRSALGLQPDNAHVHASLGHLFKRQSDFAGAEACYRQALAIAPADAETLSSLGALLNEQNRLADAQQVLQEALRIQPDFAQALNNLAVTLRGLGHLDEAEAMARKALALAPGFAAAANSLGNALYELGRYTEADNCYRQAVFQAPKFFEAYSNWGLTLHELGRLDDAQNSLQRAITIHPGHAPAHVNLGNVLMAMCRVPEAEASFRRACELQPKLASAHDNLLFALNYHPDKSAADIFSAYREYDQKFGKPVSAASSARASLDSHPKRLKIGYVSPDFRLHSSRHFLEPLLAHHDKDAVEVFAYAELTKPDAWTARYHDLVDHWIPTVGVTDEALAQRIREDGIHVLVDLAGHTRGNRLRVFAMKPAPVSVSWLGFGYTTGLSAIDYFLTDAPSVPAEDSQVFSETPWRLDRPAFVYRAPVGMPDVSVLPALRKGHVTFVSLTRAARINQHTVRVWSALLRQVEGARLVIDSGDFRDGPRQAALAAQFLQHGIGPERLDIGFHSPPWQLLAEADIALDCFPHNSGTTLFESLYMGLPCITLAGRPGVGKLGSAILHGVGHPEWIADGEDSYVRIAAQLAGDLPRLAAIRAKLRRQMQDSPLMDEAGFARKVEAAYRGMWARASTGPTASQGDIDRLSVLLQEHQFAELELLARQMTQRFPRLAMGWKFLAVALRRLGRPEEALDCNRAAVVAAPQDDEARTNLGNTLLDLERWTEALTCYLEALAIAPRNLQALNNLGHALRMAGRPQESLQYFELALQIRPDFADAANNLGQCLRDLGFFPEALPRFRAALAVDPRHADARFNLANTLKDLGQFDAALASLDMATPVDTGAQAFQTLYLFILNYHPDKPADEIFRQFLERGKHLSRSPGVVGQRRAKPSGAGRKLRLGYVSPDFRRHSCQYFLEPLLERHDRTRFEIHAYAELAQEGDAVTRRHQVLADRWTPTRGLSDAALAQRIADDGIDILVDLAGHTEGNRLAVFAHRPAPVSLSWLGFGSTTGLTAIDYFLSDWAASPPGSEAWFSETPWRLERPALVYRPAPGMGSVSPLPALERGFVTFGTLTRAVRINAHTVRLWSEILRSVENSRLVINSSDFRAPSMQAYLLGEFQRQGIAPDRLHIGYSSPPWDTLRGIDIGLDCFPHNSGTTLVESLYMGVPYISLAGRPGVGRLGAAGLHGVGHPEWCAPSEEDYVRLAVALASDLAALANVRSGLRRQMENSPLMDEAGFARGVEDAFRGMWEAAGTGLASASIPLP
jgi:predicted O-linked N-acetylglucosamine transferase (SPINDLY family)